MMRMMSRPASIVIISLSVYIEWNWNDHYTCVEWRGGSRCLSIRQMKPKKEKIS